LRRYHEVAETCGSELQACFAAICGRINTTGPGTPLVVFNPLAWNRTDAVETDFESDAPPASLQLSDPQGKQIAVQIVRDQFLRGKHVVTIAFVAADVPSLGYKTYRLTSDTPRTVPTSLKSAVEQIENRYFRVRIDPASGCLQSIVDKDHNREVLAANGQGNLIQVLDDFGDSEGYMKSATGAIEHNTWTGKRWDVTAEPRITLVERGPVRSVVEVKKKFGLARFTQRITLYDMIPRIDFSLAMDWNGENKMVKVSFPLAVTNPEATYEIPYGTIRRPSRGEEQVAQRWADISAGDYGASLLNDGRYGYDITPNVLRLSVLRCPAGPVRSRQELGQHEVKYSLYPHPGGWQNAGVVRRGYELNRPLMTVRDTPHQGDLPAAYSFAGVEPENVVLAMMKKAEDGEQLIARCYESQGKAVTARITLAAPLNVDAVHATDLLESSQQELAAQPDGFSVEMPAYSINTFKLIQD
jgi:alpha-mannosidase